MSTLPRTMKAAILTQLRSDLIVGEVSLPRYLDAGQVLVKVHYSGICGSQLGEIQGAKGEDKYLPHLLGHEASGIVGGIGAGVSFVEVGDAVVLHWRKGAGIESKPPIYEWNGQKLNAGWITTFNEYAIVSENRCTKIPAGSDMEVAALFGCAVTTGFGVVENNAKLRIGESVVVYGAGGIGLNIVQASSMASAYPIIAVDLYDNKLAKAKELGATHLLNGSNPDIKEDIIRIVGKSGLDVFIDNTGEPSIIELGYEITKYQGRVVLVGVPKANQNITLYSLPMHFGKRIIGSHGGEAIPEFDIPRYHNLYENSRLKLKELITNKYKLEEINGALNDFKGGKIAGRCLIDFN
jgi:S-(hydroxymethyl)glutathione dehydrogenase/alcohol dehydrogenase